MEFILPEKVEYIINQLLSNGYEAYAVGGCVRDTMLKRQPDDWDITTSALPMQVKEIFPRTVDTGIKHGTVTVLIDKDGYEVTTYRIDGEYEDGRHPKQVEFTSLLYEDLKRRDFTINAMAFNYSTGLVDEFDGRNDLQNKVVRCVGNPLDRFNEDALRMMRAIRFSAQLGFLIEEDTYNAIRILSPNIKKISAERIRVELTKTLLSPNPDYMIHLYKTGLTEYILDFYNQLVEENHISIIHPMLKHCNGDKEMAYAILLQHNTSDEAQKILRDLRFDNVTVKNVGKLVKYLKDDFGFNEAKIRLIMGKMSPDLFEKLLAVRRIHAKVIGNEALLEEVNKQYDIYNLIMTRGDCIYIKDMAIGGEDLVAMGIAPGKELGAKLDYIFMQVLKEPSLNTREQLMKLI